MYCMRNAIYWIFDNNSGQTLMGYFGWHFQNINNSYRLCCLGVHRFFMEFLWSLSLRYVYWFMGRFIVWCVVVYFDFFFLFSFFPFLLREFKKLYTILREEIISGIRLLILPMWKLFILYSIEVYFRCEYT